MTTEIYKIMTQDEYNLFRESRVYEGNELDKKDGFIHMSQSIEQVDKVINKFYFKKSPLYKISINSSKLPNLKYDKSKSGDIYPHEYGVLKYEYVTHVEIVQ